MPQKFIENMVDLSALVCQTHATDLRDALTRLFEKPDDEAVHDVRVTCRRMRVALDIFGPLCRKGVIKGTRKRVKGLLSLFGESRDAEVLGERARKLSHKFVAQASSLHGSPSSTGRQDACATTGRQDACATQEMASALRTLASLFEAQSRLSRLKATSEAERHNFWTLPRLIEALKNPPALRQKHVEEVLPKSVRDIGHDVIEERFEEIARYASLNALSKSEDLHELRIEFKKLRYTAEFFLPVITKVKALLSSCEGYQKILGDLHDADVAVETLSHFARRPGPVKPVVPAAILTPEPAVEAPPAPSADDDAAMYRAGEVLLNAAKSDQTRLRKLFAQSWTPARIAALQKRVDDLVKAHAKLQVIRAVKATKAGATRRVASSKAPRRTAAQ